MTEDALRDLAADGRMWASMGTVTKIETHAAWGLLLTVETEPDGCECQARYLRIGAGGRGGGQFWPVAEGDEVLVVFARGNPNAGIAIGGFSSNAAPQPGSPNDDPSIWGNDHVEFVDPGGFRVLRTAAGTTHRLVNETLLTDLKTALTEIKTALTAIGAAIPAGVVFVPVVTSTASLIAQLETAYRTTALDAE